MFAMVALSDLPKAVTSALYGEVYKLTTSPTFSRLAILHSSQEPLFSPKSKRTQLLDLGPSTLYRDRISNFNRLGAARRLNKTDAPLPHPIYLQTLALLC
jgi:hypothetical protein